MKSLMQTTHSCSLFLVMRSPIIFLDQPENTEPLPVQESLDPVRYGDWVVLGRCIDF